MKARRFLPAATEIISPFLLSAQESRLAFMLGIGISANLIVAEDGKAHPQRNEARSWLEATRAEQIGRLSLAWRASLSYRDMWHIPGLYPDESGWSYDAAAARNAVMSLLGRSATRPWLGLDQ